MKELYKRIVTASKNAWEEMKASFTQSSEVDRIIYDFKRVRDRLVDASKNLHASANEYRDMAVHYNDLRFKTRKEAFRAERMAGKIATNFLDEN